jgi:hypothetical protein
MTKRITWLDLEGRFRITLPAYNDAANAHMTPKELIDMVWAKTIAHYGLPPDHPRHIVEDTDLEPKIIACSGNDFRYAGMPDETGRKDGRYGAWEMNTDGTPRVNMEKARRVHMDRIRTVRDAELVKLDVDSLRAIEAGDSPTQASIASKKQILRDIPQTFDLTARTPQQLKGQWPVELPSVTA